MGKVTLGGLRKPDDPIHKQQVIVIGGLRGKKRSKQASSEKKTENSPKEED